MSIRSIMERGLLPVVLGWLCLANPALAQDIRNTAAIQWRDGGDAREATSNTVVQTVFRGGTPPVVTLMRRGGSDGAPTPVTGGQCRMADGGFVATPDPIGDQINPAGESLVPATDFVVGEPVFVVVTDPDRNMDPAVREISEITIRNSHDDEELLRILETGVNTGVFAGYLPTSSEQPPVRYNCLLSVGRNEAVDVAYTNPLLGTADTSKVMLALTNYVFDAATGQVVDGARITLIDDEGAPVHPRTAGGEAFPATVVSGRDVVLSSSRVQDTRNGEFQFPPISPGRYRYVIEPPSGYVLAEDAAVGAMSMMQRPDGRGYIIATGSLADVFSMSSFAAAVFDIPLRRLSNGIAVEKAASTDAAEVGETVQYVVTVTNTDAAAQARDVVVTDMLPRGFRYHGASLRRDGEPTTGASVDASGRVLTLRLGHLAGGEATRLSYLLLIGPDAPVGQAVNAARASAANNLVTATAQAVVQVRRPMMTDAMTVIGRISGGDCTTLRDDRPGMGGVRVLLEDGTQVITDANGAYHFEGVRPGLHVVQFDLDTLDPAYEAVECDPDTRRAGRAFSQFVEGSGGALLRADFHVRRRSDAQGPATVTQVAKTPAADRADADAAGAERDWLAGIADAEPTFLFPEPEHNPRAPVVRVAIRHGADQSVALTLNGAPVDVLAFDGTQFDPSGRIAVSLWRGVVLNEGLNHLSARVLAADGSVAVVLDRDVAYANTPAHAGLVEARSRLIADGLTRPVIAVRFTDADGRPLRAGATGPLQIAAPHISAMQQDLEQGRQLAGLETASAVWRIAGDDGVALIELAPTTHAGQARIAFSFDNAGVQRHEEVRAWLGADRKSWIIVGFAAGTTGFDRLSRDMEPMLDAGAERDVTEGRVSLYAKGRVRGRWLLTLAYDSDGEDAPDRGLLGQIDPDRYYAVYGDGAVQSQDTASQERLYLRLERGQFYALFGDFDTGLDRTELGRYSRVLNGVQMVREGRMVTFNAFAAMPSQRQARDEIQGDGLSGPYRLSHGGIVVNTERVRAEIRDRQRPELILEHRDLVRNVDYEIDYERRGITLRRPLASRDAEGNPNVLVIDYETFSDGERELAAGGRAAVRLGGDRFEMGATALQENLDQRATTLAAVDVTVRPVAGAEIRLEAGQSLRDTDAGEVTASAVRIEARHSSAISDVSAYYRRQDQDFGLEQQNLGDRGALKYGVDGRLRLADRLNLRASLYRQERIMTGAQRTAGDVQLDARLGAWTLRGGLISVEDIAADGAQTRSQLATFGIGRALLNNRLQLTSDIELPLDGQDEGADHPARARLGAALAINDAVRVVLAHEVSQGPYARSDATRLGFDVAPWAGSRLTATVDQRAISEAGTRTFGQFGLAQSLTLGRRWIVDAAVDASRRLAGDEVAPTGVDPTHLSPAGGFVGQGDRDETFRAMSLGATYRAEDWSWTGRVEGRQADSADRYSLTSSALRQMEDGVALGLTLRAHRLFDADGSDATLFEVQMSSARRPIDGHWSSLQSLRVRHDAVAFAGGLEATRTSRVVSDVSINYDSGIDDETMGLSVSLYHGARYTFGRFDDQDVEGFSQILGMESRLDLTSRIDVGLNLAVRHVAQGQQLAYVFGPSIGLSLARNTWVSLGYNLAGFIDRDFSAQRYTRQGAYLTLRLKFDQSSLSFLTQALEGRP